MNTAEPRLPSIWDFFILGLSIVVVGGLVVQTAYELDQEVSRLLWKFDFVVCLIFLGDFLVRFIRAENKLLFMRWGWIDLLSSIPVFVHLRWGRLASVWRIAVLLRGIRSFSHLTGIFTAHRARSSLLGLGFFVLVFVMVASIMVLHFEAEAATGNIKTAEDAIWWTLTTMSTVGYGDYFPVTSMGRLTGVFLMFVGVGVFGVISGTLAAWFVIGPKTSDNILSELSKQLDRIEKRLDEK